MRTLLRRLRDYLFLIPSNCSRERGHDGPCNGWPCEEALAKLNPDKISIEDVRSVFDISSRSAERYCEAAVRQGVFSKTVSYRLHLSEPWTRADEQQMSALADYYDQLGKEQPST